VCPKVSSNASGNAHPQSEITFATNTDMRIDALKSENKTTTRVVQAALDVIVEEQNAQKRKPDPIFWYYWF
jgi:hypothetical protein